MKTAKEWCKQFPLTNYGNIDWKGIKLIVEQIQKDAWIEGMKDAADIAENGHSNFTGLHRDWFDCKKAILEKVKSS